MAKENNFRKTTDYLGITKPAEQPHPMGSRAWWLRAAWMFAVIFVLTLAARLFF